jgi:hypothetical protein
MAYASLSHSGWGCEYHLVLDPKKSENALFQRAKSRDNKTD